MEAGDKIKVEGPPEEVEKARESLEAQAQELVGRMAFVEISVDAKYHKHIIGKGGSTGKRQQQQQHLLLDRPIELMKLSCASSDWPGGPVSPIPALLGAVFAPGRALWKRGGGLLPTGCNAYYDC